MMGVFAAADLFLFYVFWEIMLLPMALLIGVWGGENRVYASVKFVLYTMFGSLLMFVAILYCWVHSGQGGLPGHLRDRGAGSGSSRQTSSRRAQLWLFAAFALSFAIKVPMFPFHTWLPDAHVQAPTAGSVILAGVLLKMGTYGFLRFAIPFFPAAAQ
jgi:NADH-quinone oxidoreductase subunit M